ncbi:lipopolysaccharide-induced tumor necrosis factor-alpha factor homolog isoform X4 [Ranitomeya imitator]|uniref:lipopolysaccharide-induced tumor necrosis factor-alpha factor homolog isoform X4 n=1 Tax=Ranitomeya imitator TaxID=111125 RepID=UPI0037E8A7DF
MYEHGKGYPPSAPVYSQPDFGGALPPPPPYGVGGAKPTGVGGYQTSPPYAVGGAQNPGVGGAYPPPPSYGLGGVQPLGVGGGPQTTVVTAPVTSIVIIRTSFADTPVTCSCPVCHQSIVTRTEPKSGLLTWLIAGSLILLGCWLGCCLIPFFVDGCKDVDHYCPSCNHHISKYKRI